MTNEYTEELRLIKIRSILWHWSHVVLSLTKVPDQQQKNKIPRTRENKRIRFGKLFFGPLYVDDTLNLRKGK